MLRTAISNNNVNWERVVELANVELVTPALWSALVKGGLQEDLDDDVRSYLSELHSLNCQRNADIRRQVEEIVRSFNRVSVEPILLKGAAFLITGVIKDPAARMMIDIDVMIRIEDLEKVLETLSSLRYRDEVQKRSLFDLCQHLQPMFRNGEPAAIEVHTTLFHKLTDPEVVMDVEAWSDSVPVHMNGLSFRVLSPTHSIIYNVVHSEVHHENFVLGTISLRDLLDLAILSRFHSASIDWSSIEASMSKHDLRRVLRSYLHLGLKLFGSSVPPDFRPSAGSAFHYYWCLSVLSWPALQALGLLKRVFGLFSAKRMQRRFACGNDIVDLTKTRLTYAVYLVKTYIWGPKRCFLMDLLSGTGIEDASQIETNGRQK